MPLHVSLPLAVATTLLLGFVLVPCAAHLFNAHMGFSLYNVGWVAGILGTATVAVYRSFGFVPEPVFIWTTGNNLLFGTTLAPIAGHFGWRWGIVAGFLHCSLAQAVGAAHGGLVLYNNGFAAGIVAAVLVPVIIALRLVAESDLCQPAEPPEVKR